MCCGSAGRPRGWRRALTRALCGVVLLGAAACTTAQFGDAVDAFADAVDKTRDGFTALRKQDQGSVTDLAVLNAVSDRVPVVVDATCEPARAGRAAPAHNCAVETLRGGTAEELSAAQAASRGATLMAAISDYAGGLRSLVDSKDLADLGHSIGTLDGALGHLAGSVAGTGGAGAAGIVGPAAGALQWIGVTFLEQERLRAFREAVAAADPLLQSGADLLAAEARRLQARIVANRGQLLVTWRGELDAFRASRAKDPAAERARVRALVDEGTDLRQVADADVTAPFEGLKAAHAALAAAAAKPRVTLSEASAEIARFTDAATALATAAKAN